MEIDVIVEATLEQVRVESRVAGCQEVQPNSLLFDEARKTLYGIGRTEEDLKRESPEAWARRAAGLCFKPIYSAANFEPMMTWVALYFFERAIHHQARSLLALLWWGRFDRFHYELWLPNYESIPPALRQQFEQEVYFGGRREVRELVINDVARPRP